MYYFLSFIVLVITPIIIQCIAQAGEGLITALRRNKKPRYIHGHYWLLVSMGLVASGIFFTDAIGTYLEPSIGPLIVIVFLLFLFLGYLLSIRQIQTIVPSDGKPVPKEKQDHVRRRVNFLGMFSLSMAIFIVFLRGEIW